MQWDNTNNLLEHHLLSRMRGVCVACMSVVCVCVYGVYTCHVLCVRVCETHALATTPPASASLCWDDGMYHYNWLNVS